jgi:hypothetical protein
MVDFHFFLTKVFEKIYKKGGAGITMKKFEFEAIIRKQELEAN